MTIQVRSDRNLESLTPAIVDCLCLRGNIPVSQPHERTHELRGQSIGQLARLNIESRGVSTIGLSEGACLRLAMNRSALARHCGDVMLAHTTADFDNILQDVAGKSLSTGYQLAPVTWSAWARRTTARDFKTISRTQLSSAPSLAVVNEGAEYTFGTISDKKQTYILAKYGKGFSITWESFINDDLSAFTRVPMSMGQAARRVEDDVCYAVFSANSGGGQTMAEDSTNLFTSGHGNVGTSATLTAASLGEAQSLMRLQTSFGGDDFLNLAVRHILVPPALQITASVLASSTVDPSKNNATPNPFAGQLSVVVEPRLAAVDSNGWWAIADHNSIDTAEVCFLESEPEPVLQQEDSFMTDGRRYKIRHTVAAAAIDYRGFLKNAGGS